METALNASVNQVQTMRFFKKNFESSFHFLNATQFFGALNDNVFKLLVIYLLINVQGQANANAILAIAGAVFVLPFLLFSSASGVLADRLSKTKIIVFTKVTEVIVMSLAVVSVYFESGFFSYLLLFCMGAQSAVFGPSKYGIIPELVDEGKLSKANGSLTAFTYFAIILGSILASFAADVTGKNYVAVSFLCVIIALIGLATSFGIRKTTPKGSTKKINPLFVYEIYKTLALSLKRPFLFPAIMAGAFFLFIGAYVQLNIIPFAMQSLNMSELGGGYLFSFTAIGIAIGAKIAGYLSKDRVEIGLACLSGFFIVIVFFLLSIFSTNLILAFIFLTLLGVFGGMFLIPLEAFIQIASPDKRRGQVIAANNFLSFIGVLLAAFCLYLFNEELGLSAAGSFAMVGFLTLLINLVVSARMSSFFVPYFTKHILLRFLEAEIDETFPKTQTCIVMRDYRFIDILLLFLFCRDLRVVILSRPFAEFPWISGIIHGIYMLSPATNFNTTLQRLFVRAKNIKTFNRHVLILLPKDYTDDMVKSSYNKIFSPEEGELAFANVKRLYTPSSFLKRRKLIYSFYAFKPEA